MYAVPVAYKSRYQVLLRICAFTTSRKGSSSSGIACQHTHTHEYIYIYIHTYIYIHIHIFKITNIYLHTYIIHIFKKKKHKEGTFEDLYLAQPHGM